MILKNHEGKNHADDAQGVATGIANSTVKNRAARSAGFIVIHSLTVTRHWLGFRDTVLCTSAVRLCHPWAVNRARWLPTDGKAEPRMKAEARGLGGEEK